MNEFQAALGLLQLKEFEDVVKKRQKVAKLYRKELYDRKGIYFFNDFDNVTHNYSYFPILINNDEYGKSRDDVYDLLKMKNIFTRRYFYPLISQFVTYRNLPSASPANLPVAEKIAKEILCLPIYPDLTKSDQEKVIRIFKG